MREHLVDSDEFAAAFRILERRLFGLLAGKFGPLLLEVEPLRAILAVAAGDPVRQPRPDGLAIVSAILAPDRTATLGQHLL